MEQHAKVPKQTDPSNQDPSEQWRGQEDFLRNFCDALSDLKAGSQTRERAFSDKEETSEGAQEDPHGSGPKGL